MLDPDRDQLEAPHRRGLVGEHVGDAWVHRRAGTDQRHTAGEQVVDDGVVAVAAQREDRRVDGLGLLPWSNCVHYDGEPERRGDERNYQKYLDRTAELTA